MEINIYNISKRNECINQAINSLQKNEWDSTIMYCNKALDIDPTYNLAHEYKLLAEARIKSVGELICTSSDITKLNSYDSFMMYGTPEIVQLVHNKRNQNINRNVSRSDIENKKQNQSKSVVCDTGVGTVDNNKTNTEFVFNKKQKMIQKQINNSIANSADNRKKVETKSNTLNHEEKKQRFSKCIFIIGIVVFVILVSCISILIAVKGSFFHKHSWSEATCYTPRTCITCGETEGEPIEHNWSDATCASPRKCTICNSIEGEALEHIWKEATCSTPKECSLCGQTEGDSLGHDVKIGICGMCGEAVGGEKVLEIKSYLDKVNSCFGDTKNVHGEEAIYSYICTQGVDNVTAKTYLSDVIDACIGISELDSLQKKAQNVMNSLPVSVVSKGDTDSYILFLKKQQDADLKMAELTKEFANIAKKMQK